MTLRMVHQRTGQHGLGDGRGTNANIGIISASGEDFGRITVNIDEATRHTYGRSRLERDTALSKLIRVSNSVGAITCAGFQQRS